MASLISFEQAVQLLKTGNVVAIPTETVYGLAADATSDQAVVQIYTLKNRPRFNPLIVHVANLEHAKNYAEFSELALKIADLFWPGPLTLILPLKKPSQLSGLVSAGLETVAIRVPNHPLTQRLLQETLIPLAAPSANPSGKLSPTSAEAILNQFNHIELPVLDGGAAIVGLESTIVDMTQEIPCILRYGGLSIDELRKILPDISFQEATDTIKAPGQLLRHYAPHHQLRINVQEVRPDEALLAFGNPLPTKGPCLNLSPSSNLIEAASHLFSCLHQLDALPNISGIAVMPIPEEGLGFAINDRLKRGAKIGET